MPIKKKTILGITNGTLDNKEGEPVSFMVQGEHGPIEFQSFVVKPISK